MGMHGLADGHAEVVKVGGWVVSRIRNANEHKTTRPYLQQAIIDAFPFESLVPV